MGKETGDQNINKSLNIPEKKSKTQKVQTATSNETLTALSAGGLPAIGGNLNKVGFEEQFKALLATSRMQEDYSMAKNLVNVTNKNKKNPNFHALLVFALLNQAELVAFDKKENEIEDAYEKRIYKEHESQKLRENLKIQLQKNKEILENNIIMQNFQKDYQSIFANFAIDTQTLSILEECIQICKNISDQNRDKLEKTYMEIIVNETDNNIIEDCLLDQIQLHYLEEGFEPGEYPDNHLHRDITRLAVEYISNPIFILDNYHKEAIKQIWKYNHIYTILNDILDKIGEKTKIERDDLNTIFLDYREEVQSIFKKFLEKSLVEKTITEELYKDLLEIAKKGKRKE